MGNLVQKVIDRAQSKADGGLRKKQNLIISLSGPFATRDRSFLPRIVHLERLIAFPIFLVHVLERLHPAEYDKLIRYGRYVNAKVCQRIGNFGLEVEREPHRQIFAQVVHWKTIANDSY